MPQPSRPLPRLPPRAANDQAPPGPRQRTWAVRLIRKKSRFLGYVEAPDRDAAEAAAVEQFELTEEQRKRLLVSAYR